MPDTSFMAAGNAHDVENDRLQLAERLTTLVDGVELVRLIDRDYWATVRERPARKRIDPLDSWGLPAWPARLNPQHPQMARASDRLDLGLALAA